MRSARRSVRPDEREARWGRALAVAAGAVLTLAAGGCRGAGPPRTEPQPATTAATMTVTTATATTTATTTTTRECRTIDTDPEWSGIMARVGKPFPDDAALCEGRAYCCRIAHRFETTPRSRRRVVQLGLGPRDSGTGKCGPASEIPHGITEYWLVERGPSGVATSLRLLVAVHFAPYAPQHGAIEGADTFVWSVEDICYGSGAGCTPSVFASRIALSPTPHVVGEAYGQPLCPESLPLLVSADW